MFLKSITLQGFKSFPERTEITFDRGITGIVGPNGSGKSNIVDAIRWVLGEQSTKSLRGGKMEDVIFGGTPRRNALGFCEVTITIDNSDRTLADDHNEVVVGRRYYRSGESEYYLNRKAVRLKDVNELFMDTGLGRDGYSIIEQGGIDKILSARSTDRRELFEEAAGISRFRYRKEESERKLAACEENLVRAQDIIAELEGRIEPLRQQAEKARAFLVYRDEMRALEVSVWLDTLEKLKGNIKKAQTDYENAERLSSAKKEAIQNSYLKIDGLTEEIRENEARLEQLRAELSKNEAAEAQISSDIAIDETNLKNNENNIAARKESGAKREEQLKLLENEKSAKQAEKARISDELDSGRKELRRLDESSQKAVQDRTDTAAMAEKAALSAQLIKDKISAAAEKKAAFNAEIAQREARLESLDGEKAASFDRLSAEEQKAEELRRAFEESRSEKQSAENALAGFRMKADSRRRRKEEAEQRFVALRRENESKSDRLSMLESMEKEYQGFQNSVKAVMQAADKKTLSGIYGPLSTLIRVDDEYVTAIETALGSRMQNVVTDNEESAKRAVRYLQRGELGRATFLPLTAVKTYKRAKPELKNENGFLGWASDFIKTDEKFDRLCRSFSDNTAVLTNLDRAVDMAKKHSYAFRIVTLDGQLIDPSGSITGGSTQSRKISILARANEADALREELKTVSASLSEAKSAFEKAEQELERSEYDASVAAGKITEAREEMIRAQAEMGQHDALLESIRARIEAIDGEKKAALDGNAAAFAEIEKTDAEVKELETALEESENEYKKLASALEDEGMRITGLLEKRALIREGISSLEAQLNAANDAERGIDERISALTSEWRQTDLETEALADESERLRRSIDQRGENLRLCAQVSENIRASISSGMDKKLRLEGERGKEEKENQYRNEELMKMQYEVSRLENKKTQAEMEENQILDKMWTNYELTRTTAENVRVPLESVTKANRRISELRSGIRGLGDVNVGAIEEYEQVGARYEFLTAQRKDILESKEKIEAIILELEKTMKETFAAEFAKIAEHFDRTFIDLFGGGHGRLILEDENDILNCGIEIRAEIPGKTMKVLSLLSGGEKAFVAIALYFSIIKAHPTPFCVMDEIEAALDEVNVGKYAAYLHKLNDKTQFIAITHRRGTMESADVLYGATMQEQGVTSLLTLNVNEAEKKLKMELK